MSPPGWSRRWDSNPHGRPLLGRLHPLALEASAYAVLPRRELVGSRGFEPRSARSERAASADCATSRDGDHGRIRTATGQALNLLPLPDWATWPLVPPEGIGANGRIRTGMAGLEAQGPAVGRHSLWFGLRVTIPSPRAGNAVCDLHTQAERGPAHRRPLMSRRLSKNPLSSSDRLTHTRPRGGR